MNLLLDDFPSCLNGIPIDTDYRRMVQFELLLLDDTVPAADKMLLAPGLIFLKPTPYLQKAWDGLLWYYRCGQEPEENKQENYCTKRMYDFEQDAQRIYTAFLQEYQIDLQKEPLHWFKFHTLLVNLPHDSPFGQIMYYRTVNLAQLKGEERKHAMRMQSCFALDRPKATTQAQRDMEFLARIEQRRKYLQAQLDRKRGEMNGS